MLDDPDYNMRLGAYYIGSMIDDFGGSYLLAAAAYNAGPGRPAEWVGYCGDPRTSSVDPVDFIECIPFSETRNYVMRVMESAEVYRARLNGGTGPNRLATDLKRGGYVYAGYAGGGVDPGVLGDAGDAAGDRHGAAEIADIVCLRTISAVVSAQHFRTRFTLS